ncbi:helix-turn-helix domain-containing protein [Agromyces sp. MMS24-K17]|uniref:helix-turn-helix domain-containing protein n=1 Tax=Agromyces sp. MMS24-K17 TaxID=3372850 RepID=UPI003754E7A7
MPPADPTEPDSTTRFAADLRALRLAADSPTLARLQHDTGISKTVLSSAFNGRQLPSARTVDRIVRACGGDAALWIQRRDALAGLGAAGEASASAAAGSDGSATADASATPEPAAGGADGPGTAVGDDDAARPVASAVAPRKTLGRGTAALLMAAAFVLGVVAAGGVSYAVTTAALDDVRAEAAEQARKELTESPVNERAQINVHNGVDPAMSPCVNDAEVATSSPRTNNTKLEIIWSNKCYAGWGRVTRYDEQISGNSVMVAIYPETAAQGPDRQEAIEPNVQGAYTTLVVRPTPETRLCAVGAITLDGESIDLGEPLCI